MKCVRKRFCVYITFLEFQGLKNQDSYGFQNQDSLFHGLLVY